MIRKLFIPLMLMLVIAAMTSQAQDTPLTRPQPKLWFGLSGAASFNFYSGVTQKLNADVYAPTALHDGFGIRPYGSVFMEYRPNPVFGLMLHLAYEDRGAKYDEKIAPCNCPEDLTAKVSYLTVEPSIRIAPFANNFYVFAGPVLSDSYRKEFTYIQEQQPDRSGDFSDWRKWKIGAQIGAGYDIPLSSMSSQTQFALSPFIVYRPMLGEHPRNIESLSIQSLKVGLAVKFGKAKKAVVAEVIPEPIIEVAVVEPEVTFSVTSPTNIHVQRNVRETFPLRNYIFFDLGSTEIPSRYVLLRKEQVKDFKEDQIEVLAPLVQSDRPKREMTVYYNVLNILGDRMGKYPKSTIVLVGSSMEGPQDGKLMAESVKTYLVDVFGINAKRIDIEGRKKPKIPSEQPGGTLDLVLLREGDRRVSVESKSPELLMEFQSGANSPLKPVEFTTVQEAPIDSYVTFNNKGSKEAFSSWSLEIADEQGRIQNFGPYTQESVSIPGKTILGDRPVGDYTVTMIGQTKSGKVIKKESKVHMVLWTPTTTEEGLRFSVLYEFNNSKSIDLYRKYLTEVVAPKIPEGGKVIVHGYTDIIGGEENNKTLSLARANDVKAILEAALTKLGNKNVQFEVLGFGEDESVSPFANKLPEQRFYNRTVIIDIVPNN
ncbi:MAG TPA: OmpA family protein [Prolixibacteraceae bacterium]|jgi:outer membrane protein OmpA-like peptidoglycan-associated protein